MGVISTKEQENGVNSNALDHEEEGISVAFAPPELDFSNSQNAEATAGGNLQTSAGPRGANAAPFSPQASSPAPQPIAAVAPAPFRPSENSAQQEEKEGETEQENTDSTKLFSTAGDDLPPDERGNNTPFNLSAQNLTSPAAEGEANDTTSGVNNSPAPFAPAQENNSSASSGGGNGGGAAQGGGGGGGALQGPQAEGGGANTAPPTLDSSDSGALVSSLLSQPPTQMIRGLQNLGGGLSEARNNERQAAQESLPVIDRPTGLPTVEEQQTETEALEQGSEPNFQEAPASEAVTLNPTHPRPQTPVPASRVPRVAEGEIENEQQMAQSIRRIPINDNGVNTSAGPRPQVDLQGNANPQLNANRNTESDSQMEGEFGGANLAVQEDFGENNMFPTVEPETLQTEQELSQPENWSADLPEMPALEGGLEATLNPQIQAAYQAQLDEQLASTQNAQSEYETQSIAEQERGLAEIEGETERIRGEQQTAQDEGRAAVDAERENWQNENAQVREEYQNRSQSERARIDVEIEQRVASTNQEVEVELSTAESRAATEEQRANNEAAAERRRAENENSGGGLFARARRAVSNFVNSLREAVNRIFDGLRQLVSQIIEAAKSAVNSLIAMARDFVVGLIEQFATLLRELVSIALAAFPEIRDRIIGLIDRAVEATINVINQLADVLMEAVNFILDAIGSAIDAYLALYQAVVNAALDVIEFLAVGILEILEGIANLGLGIAAMPGQFPGQMSEEALGTDVTSPLAGIEKTEAELEHWNANFAMPSMEAPEGEGELPEMEASPEDELASLEVLQDDHTMLEEGPDELSPELLQSLPEFGGTLELGGSNNPVTTQDMRESVFGVEAEESAMSEGGEGAEVPMGPEEAPSPDWVSMSDNEKLDQHISMMGMNAAEMDPHSSGGGETAGNDMSFEALAAKTGRLTVGQRMQFAGRQMLQGMRMWWEANQARVYAGIAGVLLVGGLIAFFTGGAGLMAVVQGLMQLATAYFAAEAIYRIQQYLRSWASQSWEGNPEEGGKSLARGLAVVINEFVFDYLLKAAGNVMDSIKGAIRGSQRMQRVGRSVRNGLRRTGNALNRVPGVNRLRNVANRGGRYVIGGFRRNWSRGTRRLGELRQRILSRFGFDRIWMERQGNRFQLWGSFNSKVLLASGEMMEIDNAGRVGSNVDDVDDLLRSSGRAGDALDGDVRSGLILDDTGNQFTRNLETMTPTQRAELFEEMQGMTDAERMARIQSGNPRTANPDDWDLHEGAVHTELSNRFPDPETRLGQQVTFDVTLSDGRQVTIRADSVVVHPDGSIQIIDAKHQVNSEIANGLSDPSSSLTPNQSLAYPEIQNGDIQSIVPRGDNAVNLELPVGTDVSGNLGPIEIHTNGSDGSVVPFSPLFR